MKIVDFKKIIRYFSFRGSDGPKRDVYRDWKIINIFFAIVFILVILMDGYVSWANLSGLDRNVVLEEVKPAAINKASLNSALEKIKKRQAQFEDKLNAPVVLDPSL